MNYYHLSEAINRVIGKQISSSPKIGVIIISGKKIEDSPNGVTRVADVFSFRPSGIRDFLSSLSDARISFTSYQIEEIVRNYAYAKQEAKALYERTIKAKCI